MPLLILLVVDCGDERGGREWEAVDGEAVAEDVVEAGEAMLVSSSSESDRMMTSSRDAISSTIAQHRTDLFPHLHPATALSTLQQ